MASVTTSNMSSYLESKEDQFPIHIPSSDFPEHLPEPTPLYPAPPVVRGVEPILTATPPRKWTHWPLLFLGGIFVAVIAGLAGGFIGKSIGARHAASSASICNAPLPATTTSSCPSATTTAAAANATQQLADLNKDINCPAASGQTRNSSTAGVLYSLYCNVDWVASDIVSVSAWSPDECIEACQSYNEYGSNANKSCVGATYVPAWAVDLTAAYKKVKKPSSCFLKNEISGFPASKDTFDSVGICLLGKCPSD